MMKRPIGYHVMSRLADSRVIAPTPRDRRILARTILEKARDSRLLAFNAADTHLHFVLAEDLRTTNELARRIEINLHWRLELEVSFSRAHPKLIHDQSHLVNTFDYILRQKPRHGLAWDPFHEASNLPDLLGMRVLGAYTATHVRQLLPRVDRRQLLGYLGHPSLESEDMDAPLEAIVSAAISAAGLPDLKQRTSEVVVLRQAVVAVVGSRSPASELARRFGVDLRTIQRDRKMPVDALLVRAILLQLALREARGEEEEGAFAGAEAG